MNLNVRLTVSTTGIALVVVETSEVGSHRDDSLLAGQRAPSSAHSVASLDP
jgi:hypothetical protein